MHPHISIIPAIAVFVAAVIGIVYGRVTRQNRIAIPGYVLLAVAIVLGLLARFY